MMFACVSINDTQTLPLILGRSQRKSKRKKREKIEKSQKPSHMVLAIFENP
jgi:hypothetical protein